MRDPVSRLANIREADVIRIDGSASLSYRPFVSTYLKTAALLVLGVELVLRWAIQTAIPAYAAGGIYDVSPNRALAQWYGSWWHLPAVLLAAALLAYPLMRWRFARLVKKASTYDEARWARFSRRSHWWRRSLVAGGFFGWSFVSYARTLIGVLPRDIGLILRADGRWTPRWPIVHDLLWPAIGTLIFGALVFVVDWDHVLDVVPAWFQLQWNNRRALVSTVAVAAALMVALFREPITDALITVRLEDARAIVAGANAVKHIALPAHSRVELDPAGTITVRRIGEDALNVVLTGTATFDIADASDPIEVRAYNVSAQLAPGRYQIVRPIGADALHVRVERGRAWVRELTGDHKGVLLNTGEEASVL